MMKRICAALVTVALLGGALFWAGGMPGTPTGKPSQSSTPQQCIDRMFAAAENGDVAEYIDCFTGPERDRLDRELASQSAEDYAAALMQAISTLKGTAIFELGDESTPDGKQQIAVERIYANRTERQVYQLVHQGDRWRIRTVGAAAPFQPPEAYGTPVFQLQEQEQE